MTSGHDLQIDSYYHQFLSNSFVKRGEELSSMTMMMPMTAMPAMEAEGGENPSAASGLTITGRRSRLRRDWSQYHRHLQEMNDLYDFYQSEMMALRPKNQSLSQSQRASTTAESKSSSIDSNSHSNSNGSGNGSGDHNTSAVAVAEMRTKESSESDEKAFYEMNEEDYRFLYKKSYLGYFLYLQGMSIESLLATNKLLQSFVKHHDKSPGETFWQSLRGFESDYSSLIRMKHKYFSFSSSKGGGGGGGKSPNVHSIYSELIPMSILLSLFKDCEVQLQQQQEEESSSLETISRKLRQRDKEGESVRRELGSQLLQEMGQLFERSERYSYNLALTILGEVLISLHHPESTSSMASPPVETEREGKGEGEDLWRRLGEGMKKKGMRFIEENNNLSQMKGFEYLFYRMTNILL